MGLIHVSEIGLSRAGDLGGGGSNSLLWIALINYEIEFPPN